MGCCQTGPQLGGNAVGDSASGFASNLSLLKDIDAVVAVTQASVNATMMMYLSKAQLQMHEILKCYAYKPHSKGEIVEVDYKTLVDQAGGSDPFSLTDGADQTDKNVVNLAKVGFVGAFKAKGGLPRVPLANLPSIIGQAFGQSGLLQLDGLGISDMWPHIRWLRPGYRDQQDPTFRFQCKSRMVLQLLGGPHLEHYQPRRPSPGRCASTRAAVRA